MSAYSWPPSQRFGPPRELTLGSRHAAICFSTVIGRAHATAARLSAARKHLRAAAYNRPGGSRVPVGVSVGFLGSDLRLGRSRALTGCIRRPLAPGVVRLCFGPDQMPGVRGSVRIQIPLMDP